MLLLLGNPFDSYYWLLPGGLVGTALRAAHTLVNTLQTITELVVYGKVEARAPALPEESCGPIRKSKVTGKKEGHTV